MNEKTLTSFKKTISNLLKTKKAQYIWSVISEKEDLFTGTFEQSHAASTVDGLPESDFSGVKKKILPIEDFKERPDTAFLSPVEKTFLSSGTTQSARSRSYFSKDGLTLYKASTVLSFYEVLRQFSAPESFKGISLVPKPSEWPDSSLAQMIAWFSEYWQITYLEPDELNAYGKTLASEGPVFIFATAFHYVSLIDRKLRMTLPEGSLIFETGGTKGRTREVTREDFYGELKQTFGVLEDAIVSEYGMCELATPAWDFKRKDAPKRRFVFPFWVDATVTRGAGKAERSGEGSLIVEDALRIDYNYPIRTQDIVALDDKGFQFLGRSKKVPLKGCSLKAEDFLTPTPQTTEIVNTVSEDRCAGKDSTIEQARLTRLLKCIGELFRGKDFNEALEKEIGSKKVTEETTATLLECLPKNLQDFETALIESKVLEGPKKWLFILPNTHSLAGLYPLFFAAAAGRQISVRLPQPFSQKGSALGMFLRALEVACGDSIIRLASHFKISSRHKIEKTTGVFIYGSDQTIADLSDFISGLVVAKGSTISVSLMKSLSDNQVIENLSKDLLALGQRGCLSTRIVFLVGDFNDSQLYRFHQKLSLHLKESWKKELSLQDKVTLDYEELRYMRKQNLAALRQDEDDFLCPVLRLDQRTHLSEYLSTASFCFPVIVSENLSDLTTYLNTYKEVKHMTLEEQLYETLKSQKNLRARLIPLGMSQKVIWNGFYQGRPLFL